ncbi:hypothetical protein Tco_0093151 [Tanacetum coccineum]
MAIAKPHTTTTAENHNKSDHNHHQHYKVPSDPIIIKRLGELEEFIAKLVIRKIKLLETRLTSREQINKWKLWDLTKMIKSRRPACNERLLSCSLQGTPTSDMKEISAPTHFRGETMTRDMLTIDSEETKKKSKQDSPNTSPGSPPSPPPPPPPPSGASGASGTIKASDSVQAPPPPPPSSSTHQGDQSHKSTRRQPNEQAYSSGDEVGRDHIPTVNLRQSWWKPLTKDRPATLEPAWTIPSSDLTMPTAQRTSAQSSTYAPPTETLYLLQTEG